MVRIGRASDQTRNNTARSGYAPEENVISGNRKGLIPRDFRQLLERKRRAGSARMHPHG
jgi:hypothetical protein